MYKRQDIEFGQFSFVEGERLFFSNHLNEMVDLMAPGLFMVSAVGPTNGITNAFDFNSGTSMAVPNVAGAFAILKAEFPGLSVAQLLSVLQDTGAEVPGFTTKTIRIQEAFKKMKEQFGPDFSINDPCGCNDDGNCYSREGNLEFFHDVLSIRPSGGAVALTNSTVTLINNGGKGVFLSSECPNPSAIETPAVLGTTDANGEFDFSFFHSPGAKGTIEIKIGGLTRTFTVQGCSGDSCTSIPTMSIWGLFIFGLLILNLGLAFLRSEPVLVTVTE